MLPVHQLLNRIRWDDRYADAEFAIGYYDRVAERIVYVSFANLDFPTGDFFAFAMVDESGALRRIPYHRIREVLRDGRCIWSRRHH